MTFYNALRLIVWPQEDVEMARVLQVKIQQVLFEKQNYFLFMRKKGKVHLQSFWNKKGSVKQKCSSWNFGISMYQFVVSIFRTEIKMVSDLMSMLVLTVIVENESLCTHALLSFPRSFLAVNHHDIKNWVPSILTNNLWLIFMGMKQNQNGQLKKTEFF